MKLVHVAVIVISASTEKAAGETDWLVATISALLGAGVAFLGQWLLTRRSDSQLRVSLLKALRQEIDLIDQETAARAAAARESGIPLRSPLPSEAWHAIRASSVFGSLKSEFRQQLASLYADIAAANYEAAQAPTYLLISALTEGTRADAYDDLAKDVSIAPFRSVRQKVIAAKGSAEWN